MMSIKNITSERRKEIRAIKTEKEFNALTPEEKTYYRLTEPVKFIPLGKRNV